MKVADIGANTTTRVMWCERCQSVRFHVIRQMAIRNRETGAWVQFSRICSGYSPLINPFRQVRIKKSCGHKILAWLHSRQWNALIDLEVYGAVS